MEHWQLSDKRIPEGPTEAPPDPEAQRRQADENWEREEKERRDAEIKRRVHQNWRNRWL